MKAKCKNVNVDAEIISEKVTSADSINKAFTIPQLDVIAEVIKRDKMSLFVYKKSWKKSEKVNSLCEILGNNSKIKSVKKKAKWKSSNIETIKRKGVKKSKSEKGVTLSYARWIMPDRMKTWMDQISLPSSVKIDEETLEIDWYSIPEQNPATGELMCKCIDSHHLLTNLRTRTCTKGLPGVSPQAWKRVASTYETKLTPSMVDDLVDKQSNANAQTHFSEEVEQKMIENGDIREAEFCRMIRNWYNAEDSPALSAKSRIQYWMELRSFLLKNVDFTKFPPPTQYVKGFSLVAFEGFLTGIDTKIQLYYLCGSPYCVRTASSLPAKTCVGSIQDLNFSNSVAVKAKDIPNIMASLSEIMTYKTDPDRGFFFQTSRTSVYPVIEGNPSDNTSENDPTSADPKNDMKAIELRDHNFDFQSRRRTKPHRKAGTVNMNLDAAPRGAQPLRREFFQTNEAKIDALKKSGFQAKISN